MAADPLLIKTILIILIFLFAIIGVLTPRLFDPFGAKISYANLVACGVIISAALVHLLSEASIRLYSAPLPTSSGGNPYPWAYLICGLSFILLFFFERLLIHQLLHHHHHHGHQHKHDTSINDGGAEDHTDHHHHHNHHHHEHVHKVELETELHESASLIDHHHDHHHGVVPEHANDMFILLNQKNYFTAIVLLFGLGIHSILSGIALGASALNSQTLAMGIAILSHKYLASFALGCPLFKSLKSLKITILIAIFFSLLTPVGIITGMLLMRTFGDNDWISDLFICVAAGTFLYVSICEIMIPEFSEDKTIEKKIYKSLSNMNSSNACVDDACEPDHCKPKQEDNDDARKMLCVLCGFGIMSLLAVWL
eukprot:68689_1